MTLADLCCSTTETLAAAGDTNGFFSGALGTVFYTVVVFVIGALIGTPLWNWTKKFLPWNKEG
jgi:uncharacterized membrane protein YccC|tara:strand:+ start:480 stop:668 length:189 start_codon:yes stop_codon:yes gene_type:complete